MLQTLDNFIENKRTAFCNNAYVRAQGFESFYARIGPRYLDGIKYSRVLDLANIVAKKPGNGAFSRLVKDLHSRGITLYVESVMTDRFATKLLRMGFTQARNSNPPSFYLFGKAVNMTRNIPPACLR